MNACVLHYLNHDHFTETGQDINKGLAIRELRVNHVSYILVRCYFSLKKKNTALELNAVGSM